MKPSMCREEAWIELTVKVTSMKEIQSRTHIKRKHSFFSTTISVMIPRKMYLDNLIRLYTLAKSPYNITILYERDGGESE